MTKELEALNELRWYVCGDDYAKDIFDKNFQIIETTLKNQKRKLDSISEVLVDVSKGNYADLNDAINEIREVLESE